MEARCQCGAVNFRIPSDKPLALYICHCASCRRQTSSAFGTSAIFPRFAVPERNDLACYTRPTSSGNNLYCYFCRHCGTRLLHSTPSKNVVSVKGGCIEGLDWNRAIHIWTKSAMVPIPEGVEQYPGEEEDRRSSISTGSESGSYASSQEFLDQPETNGPSLVHPGGHGGGRPNVVGGSGSGSAMDEDGVKKKGSVPVQGMCDLSGFGDS